MKIIVAVFITLLCSSLASADVYVGGYFRKDGTYVEPHYRSSPDGYKWNNYGSGSGPRFQRDNDNDGMPNYQDYDDDNDGISDDYDSD